jgi:hypothetical protein
MSAFLVSPEHIDVLVDFARSASPRDIVRLPFPPAAYGLDFGGIVPTGAAWSDGRAGGEFDPREFPDQLGRGLLRANWASLEARYPGRTAEYFGNGEIVSEYRAPRRPRIFGMYPLSSDEEMGLVLKQLDCFDYQACEVADYDRSWAQAVTDRLRRAAIRRLRGYKAAPWGL